MQVPERATGGVSGQGFDAYSSRRVFSCFDGLRACAVLWVVVYHCPNTGMPVFDRFLGGGDSGVDLFFVISGFLITTLILREKPGALGSRVKNFYVRRALRIFPVYYLAVGIYWVATRFGASHRLDVYEGFVPYLLLYVSDYKMALDPLPVPVFNHSWSLGVEEKYYLIWPFVVMLLPWRRAFWVAVTLIVGSITLRFLVLQSYVGGLDPASDEFSICAQAAEARLYYAFDTRFDAIIWGAAMALVLARRRGFEFMAKLMVTPVVLGATVGLLVYGAISQNSEQTRYVLIPLLSAMVLTGYLVHPRTAGHRFLNWSPVAYIGKVSYGIYIFHPIAISIAQRLVGGKDGMKPWLILGIAPLLSVLIAGLSFKLCEQPFLKLKSKFRGS